MKKQNTAVIDNISQSDAPNKQELIRELLALEPTTMNSEQLQCALKDCINAIVSERSRVYEKSTLEKALVGKDPQEKSRLIDDYIQRTNKKRLK